MGVKSYPTLVIGLVNDGLAPNVERYCFNNCYIGDKNDITRWFGATVMPLDVAQRLY